MNMLVDRPTGRSRVKNELVASIRWELSKFLCDNFGHRGPVVGTGDVEVTGKNNRQESLKILLVPHNTHRCERYGCGELYANPDDLAVDPSTLGGPR